HDLKHLRNDLAALFDQNGITEFDVEPFDLVLIVQRRSADSRSRKQSRLENGDRSKCPRAADTDFDRKQFCRSLPCGILVCDRPARSLAGRAEFILERGRVDLY